MSAEPSYLTSPPVAAPWMARGHWNTRREPWGHFGQSALTQPQRLQLSGPGPGPAGACPRRRRILPTLAERSNHIPSWPWRVAVPHGQQVVLPARELAPRPAADPLRPSRWPGIAPADSTSQFSRITRPPSVPRRHTPLASLHTPRHSPKPAVEVNAAVQTRVGHRSAGAGSGPASGGAGLGMRLARTDVSSRCRSRTAPPDRPAGPSQN
jgi:hypothetical protein